MESAEKNKKATENKIRKKNVVFVCTGNTCRSPMAENILKYVLRERGILKFYSVKSAGLAAEIGADMSANAKLALSSLGIKPNKHTAKQLTVKAVRGAYLVVCMTERHKRAIGTDNCRTVAEICGGEDVPDPYGGDANTYLQTARYLMYAAQDIADLLEKRVKENLK